MLRKAFQRNTEQSHFIRLVLVFALTFAALHVALHDLDVYGDGLDEQGECQICRLNHVPVASLVVPVLFSPLHFFVTVRSVVISKYQPPHHFHTQWARAPPLF